MENGLDVIWVLVCTSLVFFMQAGFGCLESGFTRSKNSINVAIKNLTDLVVSCLVFWAVGYGIMFGNSYLGFFGTSEFFYTVGETNNIHFFLFQLVFAGTSTTIMSGAVAERMKFSGYVVAAVIINLFIYPVYGHAVWNSEGFLAKLGFVDFAGSTVVHGVGGWVALAAIIVLGHRIGRFKEDGSVREFNSSSLSTAVLGTFILWFGWIGFNGGSTFVLDKSVPGIILNTLVAGSAGGIFATLLVYRKTKIVHIEPLINGSLAGLVAITAGCHAVGIGASILIGCVGAAVMLGASSLLVKAKLDDAVGAIPVHLVSGIWGTVAVGIFGNLETLGTGLTRLEQISVQLAGISAAGVFVFGVSFVALYMYNKFIDSLRVSREDEIRGLNVAEHGASTDIMDLFNVMEKQSISGDLSLRVPVEPFTEVGQIATRYNSVLTMVEQKNNDLDEANNKTSSILESLAEGLVVIDKDFLIGPETSVATKKLLGHEHIEGKNFVECLFQNQGVQSAQTRTSLENFLATSFGLFLPEQFYDLLDNAPKMIQFYRSPESDDSSRNSDKSQQLEKRIYGLSYSPLIVQDEITKIIIVVSDQTEVENLKDTVLHSYKKIGSSLQNIASIAKDERKFDSVAVFLEDMTPVARQVMEQSESLENVDIAKLFRDIHAHREF